MADYEYRGTKYQVVNAEDCEVQVLLGEFVAFIHAINTKLDTTRPYLINLGTENTVADTPEEAIDRACHLIMDTMARRSRLADDHCKALSDYVDKL